MCYLVVIICQTFREWFCAVLLFQFAEKQGFQYIKERLSAGGLDAPVSHYVILQ